MNLSAKISRYLLKKKLGTVCLISISLASFASLGHGGGRKDTNNSTVSISPILNAKNFSLRSGYSYRSNDLFRKSESKNFIMLNTVITYQRGNATYVMPLKKKVLLDKIRINPLTPRY
jgi:hypothetical protein